MEIDAPTSTEMSAALAARIAIVREVATRPDALARAIEAAQIVASLTQDEPLAAGVLAHEALEPEQLENAGLARALGAETLRAAHELARFGEFGGSEQWSSTRSLSPVQAETLRKMVLGIVSDPRLVVARIAIQLARLQAAKSASTEVRAALATEARAVFAPLANRLGVWQLKWQLEDLAFRYLEPEAYAAVAAELDEKRSGRERYIQDLCELLRREMQAAHIDAEIQGRAKHLYSIWRKMQRKQLAFGDLYDVRAVRILCHSIPDCYAALGIVHSRWEFIPGQFDDYIATPKDNSYRSIHTAVHGPERRVVEVQIRTHDMHQQSELGVAAHWRYKEGGARNLGDERRIETIRRLLDTAQHSDPDPDFIERARAELFQDRVYALTPKGEVVDLPRGATPLDFAYQVHTGLGHRCRGAKVNGRIVTLTYALQNGEVVDVITGKQESPSRDWLANDQGFLISPRSRAKVRAWFRKQDAGENELAGRQLAERELSRIGAAGDLLPALVTDLKANDTTQLFRWLGEGEITVTQFVQAATRRLQRMPGRSESDSGNSAIAAAPAKTSRARRKAPARGGSPIEIEGVGDLPIILARCCKPVRPEPLVGYVTLGRGVTVHSAACASLARMRSSRPERVLNVRWKIDAGQPLPVEITVLAYDRRGLVRDLSDVIAAADIGIDALSTTTDRAKGTARTTMSISVKDLAQLTRLLRSLAGVANVLSARRTG